MQPRTKISILREHMDAGDWRGAIRIAARFPRLGEYRGPILDAQMAYTNPRFALQIGKDPEVLISNGIAALISAYAKQG